MINLKIYDPDDSTAELEAELTIILGVEDFTVIKSHAFTGTEEINYILSIGGGVVVTKVAGVISNWISKNKGKSVKIGKTEIKGYSADQIVKILKEINKK